MSTNGGGPAFPSTMDTGFHPDPGMSLRDYFAAKAMAALLTSGVAAPRYEPDDPEQAKSLAYLAYKVADAMLDERKPE